MGASAGSSLLFILLLSISLQNCHSSATPHNAATISVVGATSCTDCEEKNVKSEQAFQGLKVAVKCKTANGEYNVKGTSELDNKGEFTMELPGELLKNDGELKDPCIAQLHGPADMPCTDASELVFKSKENNKHIFAGKLSFSSATCASEFLKKFPKLHPLYKFFHKKPLPKLPFHKKHFFPPIYKPPLEKPPVYKPPIYTPPLEKPLVFKSPVYKKPCPPIFKKPLPDVYVKPLPPFAKLPPIYKKPLPLKHDHPFFKKPFFKKPFFKYPPYKKGPPVPPFHP